MGEAESHGVVAALADYRASQKQPRRIGEKVNLSDADTLLGAELDAGDTFVYLGKIWVALSGRLDNGVIHAYPWEDRADVRALIVDEDEELLVFC